MSKRIEVTRADIKEATTQLNKEVLGGFRPFQECLIATTLKRVFPRASKAHLSVGVAIAEVGKNVFDLPEKVQLKINDFMAGKRIRPFSFVLPKGKRVSL